MHQIIMKKDAGDKFDKATEQDAYNILEDLFNAGPRANKEKIMEEGIKNIGKHQKTIKREQRYKRDRQGNEQRLYLIPPNEFRQDEFKA